MVRRLALEEVISVEDAVRVETMSRVRASADRARSARSLEEATLNDKQHSFIPGMGAQGGDVWNFTVTQFGSGNITVRAWHGFLSRRKPASATPLLSTDVTQTLASRSSQELTGERFTSSVKRSRKTLRERCLELGADNMLTLTKRGKVESLEELWTSFDRFRRLMEKRFGKRFKYVAVPELHADGETYHMHIALRGFFPVEIVRPYWYRALGGHGNEQGDETPGNVDFAKRRRHGRGAGPARCRKLAAYISKYVGKGFASCSRSRRLYSASRGLRPHRVGRWHCVDWLGVKEFCVSVQSWLCNAGASAVGDCYFWSREREDGTPLMKGFILSTTGVLTC